MRPHVFVLLALAALAACGNGAGHAAAQASPDATPLPLHACETREITLDGTAMILQANLDGTPDSMTIVHAPDRDAQDKAIEDARKLFGDPRPDTRTMTHQSKWGILELTDSCGRPVSPSSPTP